jgi:hypothetical protein
MNVNDPLRMEDIMLNARITRRGRLQVLAVAGVLVATLAGTVLGQTSGTQTVVTNRTFLTPLPSRFVLHPGEAGYPRGICREHSFLRCPAVLVFGGAARGGLPTIDPAFKANLPNARVTMALEKVVNEVAGHGAIEPLEAATMDLRWQTAGSAADIEITDVSIDAKSAVPGTWTLPNPVVIYDALVFGACETLNSFPVDHYAFLDWNGAEIGAFHGVDNTTIDSTGFYTFKYSFPAEVDDGIDADASVFTLSGTLSVTCTGLNSLG